MRQAAEYLTGFSPRFRFGALNTGAMGLALLFNVGIITMIGDLMRRTLALVAEWRLTNAAIERDLEAMA